MTLWYQSFKSSDISRFRKFIILDEIILPASNFKIRKSDYRDIRKLCQHDAKSFTGTEVLPNNIILEALFKKSPVRFRDFQNSLFSWSTWLKSGFCSDSTHFSRYSPFWKSTFMTSQRCSWAYLCKYTSQTIYLALYNFTTAALTGKKPYQHICQDRLLKSISQPWNGLNCTLKKNAC